MLDAETKRRIDTARNILVGKIPDPKSQVEQITLALIYKFMDDMDAQSQERGGKASFFVGEFEKFGWRKVFDPRLGGHEMLGLYAEALQRLNQNPNVPQLFRDIFKNAFLPYRDPETLKLFLKTINEFRYDHSERLGDAFEYLLLVLGSQGDAGQFLTPRHIIGFIVDIVDPQKGETILDPACGTAGFLIAAYKHIIANNPTLSPDDRTRLMKNVVGYDISPDMVRLSLANMYLHGFPTPEIHEYDTLTSEERWNEYYDVILANPPFMSPKGGIKPHNRFSVPSKRSEVLFVDYMAEHLTPAGRAGIIVPEGIIFQSQTAYKALRKMLVEQYLVAVVSLPAGVFNPYSGVKTSILILDKSLAKQSDTVGFFKVENDGFNLGAQRRPIDKNDLPQVLAEIEEYLWRLRAKESVAAEDFTPTRGLIVAKEKIAANGEFNLSGERYRANDARSSKFPIVPLGTVSEIVAGNSPPGESYNETGEGVPFYQGKTEFGWVFIGPPVKWTTDPQRFAEAGDILMSVRAPVGPVNIATQRICIGRGLAAIKAAADRLLNVYAFHMLRSQEDRIIGDAGAAFASINRDDIEAIEIPLPPLEMQKEIVAEIEAYQKVIDGARTVLDHYRPHIPINPDWPMVDIGDISTIVRGSSPRPQGDPKFFGGPVPRLMVADITRDGMYATPQIDSLTELGATKSRPMKKGDVIITVSGNPGLPTILAVNACIHDGFVGLRELSKDVLPEYLYFQLVSQHARHGSQSVGAVFKNLTTDQISEFQIPLPPLADQEKIVAEIEAEQRLVEGNRQLIERMEQKIAATLARIWGEPSATVPEKPIPAGRKRAKA